MRKASLKRLIDPKPDSMATLRIFALVVASSRCACDSRCCVRY